MLSVAQQARDERADLLRTLRGLTPDQWDHPTLCTGWSVRDLVAHVVDYDMAGWPGTMRRLLDSRGDLDAANRAGHVLRGTLHPGDLLCELTDHLEPRGLTAMFGSRIGLLDALVHHQDIRRPLGMPRTIPRERIVPALAFARHAHAAGIPGRISGLSLDATDVGWRAGRGPVVRGPAEALLLCMAGRDVALDEVEGTGAIVLRERIAGELR